MQMLLVQIQIVHSQLGLFLVVNQVVVTKEMALVREDEKLSKSLDKLKRNLENGQFGIGRGSEK